MVDPMMNLGKNTCSSTNLMRINRVIQEQHLLFRRKLRKNCQGFSVPLSPHSCVHFGSCQEKVQSLPRSPSFSSKLGFFARFFNMSNIFNVLILSFPLLLLACTLQAPEDYYYEFALMEGWGKANREQTGRQLDEVIRHPENNKPLVIAFEVGKPPAALLGFIPYDVSDVQETDPSPDVATPKVAISLPEEMLRKLFEEKQIRVVHWRWKNGRLKDDQNIVLLNVIPRAFSERAVREEFLMIFAIVHAAQSQTDTIDVIRVIAEDENGTPQMSLEAQVVNYTAYMQGKIDGQQWEQRLRVQRF